MKTTAAVLWELNGPWSIETIDLDPPKAQEVLVELYASGMCHSDEHVVTGDMPFRLPFIGGHEGAGEVKAVGEHVTWLEPGDHVVVGTLYGSGNPRADIPKILELASTGHVDLDAMITRTYPLDDINDGYADMRSGANIRGVLIYPPAERRNVT